ncbi:hypothetical protein BHM03_00000320 [Ensete ventricosum]|uniref:RING-type domain-containing protein n=1 Tax=Ensete ventricosum TaxID=4639 RepID=A0A445M8D1_ENSVE|nr:hypothetical protein BHM03_00000320 [Ensete ventricosum]
MAVPFQSYVLVLPKPVMLFFQFLAWVDFAISLVSSYLGLCGPPEPLTPTWGEHALYLPATETPSSSIKKQLRVVAFSRFARRRRVEELTCVICLSEVAGGHEVRELGNCAHGFHADCIDRWVDVGRDTCPLCRAHLLPSV